MFNSQRTAFYEYRNGGLRETIYGSKKVARNNNERYEGYMRSDFRGWDYKEEIISDIYVGPKPTPIMENSLKKQGVTCHYV